MLLSIIITRKELTAMVYKYKTINLRLIKGIKQAEKLQSLGLKIISVGFTTVTMEKKIITLKGT